MRYFVCLNKVRWNTQDMTFKDVHGNMEFLLFPLFLCLLFSFLAAVLALICYNKRRGECRQCLCISACEKYCKAGSDNCGVLKCHYVCQYIFFQSCFTVTTAISIINIIAVGVMSSIILEIILDMNVRAGKAASYADGRGYPGIDCHLRNI